MKVCIKEWSLQAIEAYQKLWVLCSPGLRPQSSKNCKAMRDHWDISRNIWKGKDRRVLWLSESDKQTTCLSWLDSQFVRAEFHCWRKCIGPWKMWHFELCTNFAGWCAVSASANAISYQKAPWQHKTKPVWHSKQQVTKDSKDFERLLNRTVFPSHHHFAVQLVIRKNLTNCFGGTIGLCLEGTFRSCFAPQSWEQDKWFYRGHKETKRHWSLCTQNSRTIFSNRYEKVTMTSQPSIWYIFPF